MIPTTFVSPTEQALKFVTGMAEVRLSHPFIGPEYRRLTAHGERTDVCYRIDWATADGKRFFAYVKPRLLRVTRTVGYWPVKRSWEEDVDDIEASQAEAIRLIQSSVSES